MIKRALFAAFTLLTVASFAQEQTSVSSKVKSATMYLGNAELHNAASVNLKPGTNNLVFTNLTSFLDANSIRIGSDREVTITGVNVKSSYLDDSEMPAAFRELDAKLKEAELNLQIRKSYKSVYIEEKSLMISNKTILGGDSKLTPEDLNDLANIYRTRLKEIEIRIIEIGQEEAKLNQEIEKLRAQLGDRANNQVRTRSEVEVTVVSKNGGPTNFDLSYVVYTAGWAPSYELRTEDNSGKIKLLYKANVWQSTGLDWSDVKLSLSTGTPSNGAQPELGPDYVNYRSQGNYNKGAEKMYKKDLQEVEVKSSRALAMSAPEVAVTQGSVNVFFEIALPYAVPSTNRPTSVEIQSKELTADLQYLAIPKLNRDVFLVATLKGWEGLNLLPGQANIYYRNNYVGQSFIDPNASEKLEVSLGTDNGVIVERKDVNELSKDAGFLSGNKKQYHYKLLVKNTRANTISIRVQDQLPLSTNTDIVVEQESLGGGQLNAENGVVTWNLSIQPGEQRELELKYNIKFPKGSKIDH